ncbi:hypothetical protein SKAU_G00288220 [Synaphobranchus kaupii]|uniref:RRM domain-containing protein n=1 Tax=Synaphobranchus kaupii TaxID=118154 RepID=A0A9Q1ETE8_SYNKA|nr:hypothetical protein SKAU_G00288220 [Synaphobranchus kaupii]
MVFTFHSCEALSDSMDPDSGADSQRALSLQWKSYKLIQDPAIRRVAQKVYRYDGVHFSVPDSGFPPVGDLRDPRPRRIWSKHTELVLPVPKFKLDEYYVGPIPLKEVTFARLNDNIREPFLAEMCAKFGEVEEMEILFHPKTRKHLGLARVLFTSTRGAKDTVKHLHNTSVMGNIVHAQLDIKGQQRMKYYDLIVSGSYTPQTVPTGGKALTERFLPPVPTHPDTSSDVRRRLSADVMTASMGVPPLTPGSTTPCSSDAGFSEQRLDTPPSSLGGPYTPGSSTSSQGGGTPYTPRSGTPFSQDSGFSNRHGSVGFGGGNSYPPPDLLPTSSCSSSAVSSSSSIGGYKASRYHEEPHALPQEHLPYPRGRPAYPPAAPYRPNDPPAYSAFSNTGGGGPHMQLHPPFPPPPPSSQYDPPSHSERERERERERDRERERERERDRDPMGRYGSGIGSRRSSYHHPQDTNSSSSSSSSSSKAVYHSHHHSERREERGHRSGSSGSAPRSGDHAHQRHRNHHSHNHHSSSGRRRSSRDRERERERDRDRERDRTRDSEYPNSSNSFSHPNSGSGHPSSSSAQVSSNSLSPPPSSYPYPSSKEQPPLPPHDPPPPSHLEPPPVFRPPAGGGVGERSTGTDKDYRLLPHHTALPPPPPPPLPPASVIAAAVAESYGAMDYGQDSPEKEQWRNSSSPEPDSTNESLPFVYHSSSLDSRIEMLLKEQKAKFSFLASDDEEEEKKGEEEEGRVAGGGAPSGGGGATATGLEGRKSKQKEEDIERDRHRRRDGGGATGPAQQDGGRPRRKGERERERDGRRRRGRKEGAEAEGKKSPAQAATAPSSTSSAHTPPPDSAPTVLSRAEPAHSGPTDPRKRHGAHTPSTYNGQGQPSPHSSGEDMEISDEDDGNAMAAGSTAPPPSSSPAPSSQSAQPADPSSSSPPPPLSDSTQHFGAVLPPPMPSYPPHLPPPPPPGFSLQPPPPPGIPPPLPHMELHPEYPPPIPPHMYDYASSMELMSQYSGGAPMSFQMQTQMLSRLHQLRMSSSNGAASPGDAPPSDYPPSYPHGLSHLHSLPPPPHHPYMDQEGGAVRYDQDHRYMPPPMPYAYPDPHNPQLPPPPPPHHHGLPPPPSPWPPHMLPHHYPSYLHPPPGAPAPPPYGPLSGASPAGSSSYGPQFGAGESQHPHEATVQMVLATLIQEMKNIMQRDLNRKMVENIAFGTFDEWWERKERKAKPFQTAVRGLTASGGLEGFSLRGALRLPSFKVKRKELPDGGELKRSRPSTTPTRKTKTCTRRKARGRGDVGRLLLRQGG